MACFGFVPASFVAVSGSGRSDTFGDGNRLVREVDYGHRPVATEIPNRCVLKMPTISRQSADTPQEWGVAGFPRVSGRQDSFTDNCKPAEMNA